MENLKLLETLPNMQSILSPEAFKNLTSALKEPDARKSHQMEVEEEENKIKRLSLSLEEISSDQKSGSDKSDPNPSVEEVDVVNTSSTTTTSSSTPSQTSKSVKRSFADHAKFSPFSMENLLAPSRKKQNLSVTVPNLTVTPPALTLPVNHLSSTPKSTSTPKNLAQNLPPATSNFSKLNEIMNNLSANGIETGNLMEILYRQNQNGGAENLDSVRSCQNQHESEDHKYKCHLCSKTFKRSSTLATHWLLGGEQFFNFLFF